MEKTNSDHSLSEFRRLLIEFGYRTPAGLFSTWFFIGYWILNRAEFLFGPFLYHGLHGLHGWGGGGLRGGDRDNQVTWIARITGLPGLLSRMTQMIWIARK